MTERHQPGFLGKVQKGNVNRLIEHAMGIPVQLMTRFGGSDTAKRLGLLEPAQRFLYGRAKHGLQTANQVANRFKKRPAAKKPDRMARPDKPNVFDLNLTDDQQLARDTMHRFAEDVMRTSAEEADESCTPPSTYLQQSHELGLTMMAVPESHSGCGEQRSVVSSTLIAEDLAWGDMGLAFAALAPLSVVNALVDWGTNEQQARYLPSFAEETAVPASMAVLEPDPLFDPNRLRTQAVRNGDGGYRLFGKKSMVPLGNTAQLFLIAADVMGLGPRLFIIEPGVPGLTVEPEPTMGLRSAGLCKLGLDKVDVAADAMMGEPGREGFDYQAVIDRARIGWAALAVGTCQAVLDYVIPYCNERIAFGEPISNRQAVAFMIADLAIELDGMRLLTYRAASRADQGLSFHREAYLARVQCAERAMKIGNDGVQLLGGHGYVKDHPVERWYRHLRGIAVLEGGLLV